MIYIYMLCILYIHMYIILKYTHVYKYIHTYVYIYTFFYMPPYEIFPLRPVAGSGLVCSYLCLRCCMLPCTAPIY